MCAHTHTHTGIHLKNQPFLSSPAQPLDASSTLQDCNSITGVLQAAAQHTLPILVNSQAPWHSKPILGSLTIFNLTQIHQARLEVIQNLVLKPTGLIQGTSHEQQIF